MTSAKEGGTCGFENSVMSAPAGNVDPPPATTRPVADAPIACSTPATRPARTAAPSAFTGGEVMCSTATPFFRAHLTALLVAILLLQY